MEQPGRGLAGGTGAGGTGSARPSSLESIVVILQVRNASPEWAWPPGLPASNATSTLRHMPKSSLVRLGWAFGAGCLGSGGPGMRSRAAQPNVGPACGVSTEMLASI